MNHTYHLSTKEVSWEMLYHIATYISLARNYVATPSYNGG